MKTLLVLLALLSSAHAAPFLVCDEYPTNTEAGLNIATFTIGGLPGSPITIPATINTTTQGQYVHYATNVYGASGAAATVVFTRGVPSAPGNLRISAQ